MDSNNSGSLQSSSGGDEEYDSRAESISALLTNPQQQPPAFHLHHHHSSSLFDQQPNYFDYLSSRPPPILPNLDPVWSKPTRSETNSTEIGPIMASSSTRPSLLNSPSPIPYNNPITVNENAVRASSASDQTHVVRNPKKRPRASRRAPTTVLTTDTTNFRAMVQEFTGIPAPPFTTSPFNRTRLDLFGAPSAIRSGHLLRPFAQKIQPLIPFSSSTTATTAANILSGTNSNASNSTSINYQQLPSELGLLNKQNHNLLNMQNQMLNFQSFLQPPQKYPLQNPQGNNDSHNLKMGVFEEFGLGHGGMPNMGLSENNQANEGHQGHLNSLNGTSYSDNNSQRTTNGKLRYSASTSDFHADKGSDNVSTRGEGMVESWICSSD